jgi:hypothetical protein
LFQPLDHLLREQPLNVVGQFVVLHLVGARRRVQGGGRGGRRGRVPPTDR